MSDAAFWNKIAAKYSKDTISDMPAYVQTRDRMLELLQPHHRVLELGCGTGSTAYELANGVDRYIGTDVSPAMIEIAQAKQTSDTPEHLSFAVQDVTTMPAGQNDVVLALNLFHLVPNLEEALNGIFAALPSGGMLIAKTALMKDGPWIIPKVLPFLKMIGKAPSFRNLNEAELIGLFENTGFVVNETLIQKGMVPRIFTVVTKP